MQTVTSALLLLLIVAPAVAQDTGGQPVAPNAEINARFDQLRALDMIMRGRWPHDPFKTTIQGSPAAVNVPDLAAPPQARKEFDRGMDALSRADGPASLEHFQKALQIYPRYTAAYNNMGVVLMYMKDFDKAHAAFDHALALTDRSPVILLNLCRVSLEQRQFEQAEGFADKAASLDHSLETLTLLTFTKFLNNKWDETVADGRKVHATPKHDGYAIAHFLVAYSLQKNGKNEDAIAEYKQFLKEDPRNPRAEVARKALQDLGEKK